MLPHTKLGVRSDADAEGDVDVVEGRRRERSGLRAQVVAEERAVAVSRMSGWRIRRLAVLVKVIVAVGRGAPVVLV